MLDRARAGTPVCSSPQAGVQRRAAARARRSRARSRARTPRRRAPPGGSRARARTRARRRCRGAAAGRCRPARRSGVRIGSITITSPGASRSQWSCGVRRARRRVRAPHDDAGGVGRRLGIEALLARAVDVRERDVARVVADGVRLDLGRAEAVEEALRERRVDERAGAGVVRVEDARGAVLARRSRRAGRPRRRSPPAIRSARTAPRPSARRAAAASSAAAPGRDRRRCSRSSTCGRACRARRDAPDRRARA